MEPEMVSTTVDNAPAFLQLKEKYKQELVEDTRLSKAADLAARQHVLLTSEVPDAWKRPQLKAVSRQLRHWTKKVRQPFGAPAGGVDYDKAKTLKDKWVADRKMIAKIDQLPGRKTLTERIVRRIMKTKLRLGM